ncbi:MAG TPA: gluconokinase, partial [Gemmatimonadales bacterium]
VGTLLAGALGVAFLEGDDLHPADNVRRMAQGIPLTDDDRRAWLASIAARLAEARRTDTGLVVACSALKRAYRDLLRRADPDIRFVHLTGDPVLIARRLSQRAAHFMPATLLGSQLRTLEPPTPEEHAWTFDLAHTPESIVDEIVVRLSA